MVRVVRTTSLDDMYSENIWFSCYKPFKYQEKLICYACDGGGRTNGKWKIVQCSVGPETAKMRHQHLIKVPYQQGTNHLFN